MDALFKEYKDELQNKCRMLEENCAKAQSLYAYRKQVLECYDETVAPFVEPFKKVMGCLIYFVACADPELYNNGKPALDNKLSALRSGMQPGMWGQNLDEAHLDRINEMFAVPQPDTVFTFRPEPDADIKSVSQAYEGRIKAASDRLNRFNIENEKLANRITHANLLCEYVNLLRSFMPQLEQIKEFTEEETTAEWARNVGKDLLSVVENHSCRNESMAFTWVYPRGEIAAKSEKIRVQFISAEVDCPGLYYRIRTSHEQASVLGCVFPGCTKD